MTAFAVVRAGDSRVAAVLVDRRRLTAPGADRFLRWLESELALPVMLVARDDAVLVGARVRAEFDAKPYLFALMRAPDLEWTQIDESSLDEHFN